MPLRTTYAGSSLRNLGFQAGIEIGDFEPIASQTLTGTQASVTFSSIPQNYKHLQLRVSARVNSGDSYQLLAQFNGDTATNYSWHYLFGNGSTVGVGNASNQSFASVGSHPGAGTTLANIFGVTICDILDYSNTNKYKTTRATSGGARNVLPAYVFIPSSNWRSTSGITSIYLYSEGGASFVEYSHFALYGIKG